MMAAIVVKDFISYVAGQLPPWLVGYDYHLFI